MEFLRIYVLWAEESVEGARLAELVSSHFDGLGMERDGVAIRIPVRFRSVPWEVGGELPTLIDLTTACHNAVVLLYDGFMQENAQAWGGYVAELRARMATRGNADVYVPFGSPDGSHQLPGDGAVQYARRDKWALPNRQSRDIRFRLHLVFRLRAFLSGDDKPHEPLFVSHAKIDGDGAARAIIDYVNQIDQDVPLRGFYDAKELVPGEEFQVRFVEEIQRGTLLAIVSDIYDSRPWCIFELTTAKHHQRPIVLADVGKTRTSRTYPYGANLPKLRVTAQAGETAWIEELLIETLSEGLRCDLFKAQANLSAVAAGIANPLILPRPPELFDLVQQEIKGRSIIYPDPPLGRLEWQLLQKANRDNAQIFTLSEVLSSLNSK